MNNGGPAFPVYTYDFNSGDGQVVRQTDYGMSLRDWFAGMALQGQLQCIGNQSDPYKRAKEAYAFADQMLKQRELLC